MKHVKSQKMKLLSEEVPLRQITLAMRLITVSRSGQMISH
jgi:hypothetical protein